MLHDSQCRMDSGDSEGRAPLSRMLEIEPLLYLPLMPGRRVWLLRLLDLLDRRALCQLI